MGSFREFLCENEELKQQLISTIKELDDDELDELGYVLYYEFFDNEEESDYDSFDIEDVNDMINRLGDEMLDDVLDLLSDDEDYEIDESVSRRMGPKSFNRKKRKYMSTSKAELRRTKQSRKKSTRKNKPKAKRYYKANKLKIAKYQKSRSSAIKKGKHIVKKRRSS